jgi:predicted metal-dependent peptidase
MQKFALLIIVVSSFVFSAPLQVVLAQEETESVPVEQAPEVEAVEDDVVDSEASDEEEVIVDDEFYQDVDDEDFRPSEDIPADQSIPFPTDI